MNPVRALKAGRCAQCKGPIHRTEMIVRGTADTWVHADCEPDFTPWDEQTIDHCREIVRAFENWKAIAFEHDCLHYGLSLTETEWAGLSAVIGREIARAGGMDERDDQLVANLGVGFMCGYAVRQHEER